MVQTLMIQGTASGVGKTILTLAICRILYQDGLRVAPFKSQNMTSKTALLPDGTQIAISQVLQALACGRRPCVAMNPIILKYGTGSSGSELILHGKSQGSIDPYRFRESRIEMLVEIRRAYDALAQENDYIIIEGAGSPVELNMNSNDIVNMGIAKLVQAPVILASDIDRGGVFASLYGTIGLLSEEERGYVKALVVNRLKGRPEYFAGGAEILTNLTGLPVAGVVPYMPVDLPQEDSLFTEQRSFADTDSYEAQFDSIAATVRQALDMELVYRILREGISSLKQRGHTTC